jgi:neutral ceramidase
MGRALALEALHSVGQRRAWPARVVREPWGSVTPISIYRHHPVEAAEQVLAVAEERASFPLQPVPTLEEIRELRAGFDANVEAARAEGADAGRLRTLAYHSRWAEQTEERIAAGDVPTSLDGPITAVRIGDGVIATGPGEIFGEIGMAVKERSPADVTLYAGYTNGIVTYFPTAAEYPFGGYEPDYGNRSFGQPAQVAPESEQVLTETAVRLVGSLFPEREAPRVEGWTATGALPTPPPPDVDEFPGD